MVGWLPGGAAAAHHAHLARIDDVKLVALVPFSDHKLPCATTGHERTWRLTWRVCRTGSVVAALQPLGHRRPLLRRQRREDRLRTTNNMLSAQERCEKRSTGLDGGGCRGKAAHHVADNLLRLLRRILRNTHKQALA